MPWGGGEDIASIGATGTPISSAWLPSRIEPGSPPVPQTSAPTQSAGPASTTPEKSRPGIRGNVVLFHPAGNIFDVARIDRSRHDTHHCRVFIGGWRGHLRQFKN
jgi:hypothetical protein